MPSSRSTAMLLALLMIIAPPLSTIAEEDGKWDASGGCTCHGEVAPVPTPTHNFPNSYNPLQNYSLTIGMSGGVSGSKGGFNLEVSDGNLFTGIGIGNVQVNSVGDQATHIFPDYRTWSVNWQAPAGGSGQVTFALAVLAANGNGQNSGDSWAITSHTVPQSANTPPTASNVEFLPSEPTKASGLAVSYTYDDADGDAESGTEIRWSKNGDSWTMVDDMESVPEQYLQKEDEWEVEVKPKDGTDFGEPVSIGPVTIGNSRPIASNLEISPESPTENNDLNLDYDYFDHDGDSESSNTTIHWYLDDVRQTGLDGISTVPSVAVRSGDSWQAAVTPHDGEDTGDTVWSSTIIIGSSNSPPTVSVYITPSNGANSGDTLGVLVSASDPDGQQIQSTQIVWKKNGAQVAAFNDATEVPSSATSKGETWTVEARASDGIAWSSWKMSESLTIHNTPPEIVSVSILPQGDISSWDDLTVVWEQTDLDGDNQSNSQITWWVDGEWIQKYNGWTTIPYNETILDHTWAAEVRPGDGEDLGVAVRTSGRAILSGGPTAPLIDLGPWEGAWTGAIADMPEVNEDVTQDALHDLYLHAGADDADGLFLIFETTWTRNGFSVPDLDGMHVVPANRLEPGQEWTVTVTANNSWGITNSASKSITIINLNPDATWTTNPETPVPGAMVSFDASASSDPDGQVVAWLWTIDGVEMSGQSIEIPLGGGSHNVVLTVIDEIGASDSAQSSLSFGTMPSVESLEASLDGTRVILQWDWAGSPTEFRVYRSTSPITSVVGLTAMDPTPDLGEPVPVAMQPVGTTLENSWSEPAPAATTLYYAITSFSKGQEVIMFDGGANTVSVNATAAASSVDTAPTGSTPILTIPVTVLMALMGIGSIVLSITHRRGRI